MSYFLSFLFVFAGPACRLIKHKKGMEKLPVQTEPLYFAKPWGILPDVAEMANMHLQSLLISIPVNA